MSHKIDQEISISSTRRSISISFSYYSLMVLVIPAVAVIGDVLLGVVVGGDALLVDVTGVVVGAVGDPSLDVFYNY